MSKVEVVAATEKDAPLLMEMIMELATFEKLPEQVVINEVQLADHLKRGVAKCLFVMEDGYAAAMTVYCFTYHTWVGEVLHMEDLYVRHSHRRKGYGKLLWKSLAQIAKDKNCGFLQWMCLDWNTNALDFYKQVPSAQDMTDVEGWKYFRMDKKGIEDLAKS